MRISDWSSDVCSSDLVYAELTAAQLPEFGVTPDADALARVLGLDAADLRSGSEGPRAVSCGLPFVLVPLRAPELLAAIDFDAAGGPEERRGGKECGRTGRSRWWPYS